MQNALDHRAPLGKVRSPATEQSKLVHHPLVEPLLVEKQRDLIYAGHISTLDDRAELDVAEKRDLAFHFLGESALGSADKNVGLNSDFHQLANRVLRRFGLYFPRSRDKRHEREVDENRVLSSDIVAELADRLEERQ